MVCELTRAESSGIVDVPCKMCIALHTECSPSCASKRWEQRRLLEKQSQREHVDDGETGEKALMTPEKTARPLQQVGDETHLLQQKGSGDSSDRGNASVPLMVGGLPARPAREAPRAARDVGKDKNFSTETQSNRAGDGNSTNAPLVTRALPPRPVREAPKAARDVPKEKQLSRETESNHAGDDNSTKSPLVNAELPPKPVQEAPKAADFVAQEKQLLEETKSSDAVDGENSVIDFDGISASRIEDCVLVFYDFETTGLNWRNAGITEIAAQRIHYKDGSWVRDGESLEFFVNPGRPVPSEITKLTGITTEMVRDAVGLEEGLEKLQAYIAASAPRPTIPMAHNGKAYDRQFVRYKWPKSIRGPFDPPNVQYWGDSISLFKLLSPGRFEKYALSMLYESLEGPKTIAHRALADVRMMEYCINALWSSRVATFDSRLEILHKMASTKKGAPPKALLMNSTVFKLLED